MKSIYDRRDYKYIVLPNNMKCFLISDPVSEKSAASLQVQVGCLQDPKDCSGVAKLLSSVLMNDSKHQSYDEFLLRNGGKSNSYTSLDTTNFHFEVFNQGFDEGLHRFSEFFSKPKFKNTK